MTSSRSELKKGLQDSKHRQRMAEPLDQAWQRALEGEKSIAADGEIRLIRWPDDEDRPRPQILRGARLRIEEVFSELS